MNSKIHVPHVATDITVHAQQQGYPILNNEADYITKYTLMIKRRLAGVFVSTGQEFKWTLFNKQFTCRIVSVQPNESKCKIDRHSTQFHFERDVTAVALNAEEEQSIHIVGLRDAIYSSFTHSEAYRKLGIPVAKSILIHGVAGVGKTWLVERVSQSLATSIYPISVHDLLTFSDAEYDLKEFSNYNPLRLTVSNAIANAPSIVVIHDLDYLASGGDKTRRILDIISKEIERIGGDSEQVCIIGLARDLRSLPEVFRKTDMFRQHMSIPIPSLPQRKVLLQYFLQSLDLQQVTNDNSLNYYATQISMRTSGYVARDLKLLVRQAKLKSLRRYKQQDIADQLKQLDLSHTSDITTVTVRWSDFEYALESYCPSQRTEIESTLPKRDWSELGGYKAIIARMKQAVLLPLLQPHVFTKLGIKPPSGLLLYGPSGCGKTALVQALVSESMMNVISIKGPEIFSKYLGETENKLRKIFATAKRISPCIIFVDEMDAIGTKRGFNSAGGDSSGGVNERVLSTLLNEMDGVEGRQGVVVIGCTNRPDQIDDAILRPGRLDQLIYVGLPTLEDRVDIIKTVMKGVSCKDITVEELAKQTEFCTGADIENLFREAGTAALRKDIHTEYIMSDHIQSVIIPVIERAEDQVLEGRLDLYEKFLHDHTL